MFIDELKNYNWEIKINVVKQIIYIIKEIHSNNKSFYHLKITDIELIKSNVNYLFDVNINNTNYHEIFLPERDVFHLGLIILEIMSDDYCYDVPKKIPKHIPEHIRNIIKNCLILNHIKRFTLDNILISFESFNIVHNSKKIKTFSLRLKFKNNKRH